MSYPKCASLQLQNSTAICKCGVYFSVSNMDNVTFVCLHSCSTPEMLHILWLFVDIKLRFRTYKNICLKLPSLNVNLGTVLRSQAEFESWFWVCRLENLFDKSTKCAYFLGYRSPWDRQTVFHFYWNMGLLRTLYHMGFQRSYLKIIMLWTLDMLLYYLYDFPNSGLT